RIVVVLVVGGPGGPDRQQIVVRRARGMSHLADGLRIALAAVDPRLDLFAGLRGWGRSIDAVGEACEYLHAVGRERHAELAPAVAIDGVPRIAEPAGTESRRVVGHDLRQLEIGAEAAVVEVVVFL